ncbi:MAG: Holliday junction branch migration protein RuvA [Ruminococcaceae bacterium]|nr:Holliday junction branch migration protein RuvA [Oscillospiraceae bacterium]
MFYYLKGNLQFLFPDFAVIDAGGVGYKLTVSKNTFAYLSPLYGKTAMLFTYMAVREDAVELYGFGTEDELSAFKHLITVSGVGPKAAINVLSTFTADGLASVIASGDAKTLSKTPGVGLKTAQKIILELKDKISGEIVSSYPAESSFVTAASGGGSDAVDTLAVLGYTRAQAVAALKGIDPTLPLETIIGEALKKLASM